MVKEAFKHTARGGATIEAGAMLCYYTDTGCFGWSPVMVRVERVTRHYVFLTDEWGNHGKKAVDWCCRELRKPGPDFLADVNPKFATMPAWSGKRATRTP